MGEGLITLEVKQSLEEIIKHCFYANRIFDRMSSIISVKFVMPNTSNIVHQKIAHLYPLLADDISDYMDSRNCTTIYGETIKGDQDYENYIECFRNALEIQLNLESLVRDAIVVAQNNNDYTTKVFLDNFLLNLISLTQSIVTLVDKAEIYGESNINLSHFDNDIKDFPIFNN